MLDHFLAPKAQRDIKSILQWTHDQFGQRQRARYEALIIRAIADVVRAPDRVGSQSRPDIGDAVFTYHLWHSRKQIGRGIGVVNQPRHFLLYRILNGKVIEISRVLHDRMELDENLPEDYPATDLD